MIFKNSRREKPLSAQKERAHLNDDFPTTSINGLDINKIANGIRLAVIDDLIKDLENLKIEIRKVNTEKLRKKLESIFE